jgi:hypothetical protein
VCASVKVPNVPNAMRPSPAAITTTDSTTFRGTDLGFAGTV